MEFPKKRSFLKLPVSVDVDRILSDMGSLSSSDWSKSHWSVHSKTRFVLLRGGQTGTEEDFTTDNPVDSSILARMPYVAGLLSPEGPFGEVRYAYIFAMNAQSMTLPHIDDAAVWYDLFRIHIPIVTHEKALLIAEGYGAHFGLGEVWTFDNQQGHAAVNMGPERIHLIIDVAPGPALEALVTDAQFVPGELDERLWQMLENGPKAPKRRSPAIPSFRMTDLDSRSLEADFGFEEEADIKAAVKKVRHHTMTSFERLATLWQQVRYLDRFEIPGSLMECGVWRGGCIGLMALAHMHSAGQPWRELHLFDSFVGLHRPDRRHDGDRAIELAEGEADGALQPIGACVAEMDESRTLLTELGYPEHLIKYHVGWFQDTIPDAAPTMEPIALLRLDGDWYESTRIALEHLYEKVAPLGVIVADDYGHFEGCRKAVDEFIERQRKPILLNHIDYTGRFWLKV